MRSYEKTRKPDEFFLLTEYVSRKLAYPVALLCQRLGVSANFVTLLGGCLWVASVPLVLAAGWMFGGGSEGPAWIMLFSAGLLWVVGYLLDVVDGSLARLTSTQSSAGFYLDYYFHLLFMPMFLCSIGVSLYLATSSFPLLLLAVFSIGCNWGVSFSAKEHVLAEEIAKGRCDPSALSEEERYRIFIDSTTTKARVTEKTGPALWTHLAREMFCFPGQFILLSALLLFDWLLSFGIGSVLVLLKTGFVVISVVMLSRVPARLIREYRTMRTYDRLKDEHSLKTAKEDDPD